MKKKPRSYRVYSIDFKQEAVCRMAQAKTIVGLAQELGTQRDSDGFGGSCSTNGATNFRRATEWGWSDGEAGRLGAGHRRFRRQHPVRPTCELLSSARVPFT